MADTAASGENLLQQGMESLFEDQKFSGNLMSKLFRMGLCEGDMDAIFKRAEDDIMGFVGALSDVGAGAESIEALNGYVFRLKQQILRNPLVYFQGS